MARPKKSAAAEKPAVAAKTTSRAAKKTAEAAKKAEEAAKKVEEAVKETPASKTEKEAPAEKLVKNAAKKSAEKVVTKVQFGDREYDVAEIIEKAKADHKANNKGAVKTLNVYIKPEDNAAYYVVNGEITGKVDL